MSDNSNRQTAPALDKGLEIIELLSSRAKPLLLTEIARGLDRKVSEIQRMVQTLVTRGYLYRESQGGYFLSSKLFRLAHQYPPFQHLVEIARPAMEAFSHKTGESVHLCVEYEQKGLILSECQGDALVRITLRVGAMLPLLETVSGIILLDPLSPEQVKSLIEREGGPVPARAAEKGLRDFRKQGFLYRLSAAYHGLHDLGVAIQLPDGTTVAALTTTWAQSRTRPATENDLLPPLQKSAAAINARLSGN